MFVLEKFQRTSHIHFNACSLGVQDVNHVYCPCADCVMKTPGGMYTGNMYMYVHVCVCVCMYIRVCVVHVTFVSISAVRLTSAYCYR